MVWLAGTATGRPASAAARAFVAKAVLGLPQTNQLIDRLIADKTLRRLCGRESRGQIPSESTFSRTFAEFAASALPTRGREALIKPTHAERLVGHISRNSTAIEACERWQATEIQKAQQPVRDKSRSPPRRRLELARDSPKVQEG